MNFYGIFVFLLELLDRSSGPFNLYDEGFDNEFAAKIKGNDEKDFLGPYYEYDFNGKEADVIIYVTSRDPSIQSMARAKRLLILVTIDQKEGNFWKDDSEHFKAMNSAVEQKLVKKYCASLNQKQNFTWPKPQILDDDVLEL